MTIIPIIKEIPLLDSGGIFSLLLENNYPFFLDSGMNKYRLGRYSFMGCEPFLVFKSRDKKMEIFEGDIKKEFEDDPFEVLRSLVNQYELQQIPTLPSFTGGAVGYFSYEMRHLIEDVPGKTIDDLEIPHCIFCFYDLILIFDHLKRKTYLSSSGFPEKGRLREIKAKSRLNELLTRLSGQTLKGETKVVSIHSLTSNMTQEKYLKAVKRAKEYICAGDIYQVNLSQRFCSELSIPAFEVYKRLRRLNPAPFACFLDLKDVIIASASPERFLYVEGKEVITRPIKGTKPRGKSKIEDLRLKNELKTSQKDKAELVMIVDLLRNDLGRVCKLGSIRVKKLIKLETHPTVFHTVGIIGGELKKEKDRFDLIKACFPGGSITGAPKIRAQEIIDELEPTKRHIYTGSIGYLSFSQSMDLNIAIRTFVIKDNKVYFQVGGGIVADSLPEDEYLETLHKGKALMEALELP